MSSGQLRALPPGRAVLPRSSVYGICLRGNQVLLTKPLWSAQWELPGGKVEEGEDPFAALRREIAEETGYQVPPQAFRPLGEHREFFYIEHRDEYYDSHLRFFLFGDPGSRDPARMDAETVDVGWRDLFLLTEKEVHRNSWRELNLLRKRLTRG